MLQTNCEVRKMSNYFKNKLKEVALSKKFEENNDWISHGNK